MSILAVTASQEMCVTRALMWQYLPTHEGLIWFLSICLTQKPLVSKTKNCVLRFSQSSLQGRTASLNPPKMLLFAQSSNKRIKELMCIVLAVFNRVSRRDGVRRNKTWRLSALCSPHLQIKSHNRISERHCLACA